MRHTRYVSGLAAMRGNVLQTKPYSKPYRTSSKKATALLPLSPNLLWFLIVDGKSSGCSTKQGTVAQNNLRLVRAQ